MVDLVALSGRPKDKLIQFVLDRSKAKIDKLKWPMIASEKIDGVYCMAVKARERLDSISVGESVYIFSRTGEQYTSMKHIESLLNDIMGVNDIVIFEACAQMGTPQSTVSGWARDTKEQHPELIAACHDLITLDVFRGFDKGLPYVQRRAALTDLILKHKFRCTRANLYSVIGIAIEFLYSWEEALRWAESVWSHGGEGVVLRNPDALYQGGKRNQDIVKIKQGVSFDLEVIGMAEGTGKYAETLGSLICRWKDDQRIYISGMTDSQRAWWWQVPSEIIGKIVQVDAMCESSKGLLREPRFKGIRHDKTEGDF